MSRFCLLVLSGVLSLAACSKQIEAPTDTGVCWHMVTTKDGQTRFNQVAKNVPSIERCAVELEQVRLRFAGLGLARSDMIGAFQGEFLFLQPEGIYVGHSLNGGHYLLLVRTGDGRLAKPGVLPVD